VGEDLEHGFKNCVELWVVSYLSVTVPLLYKTDQMFKQDVGILAVCGQYKGRILSYLQNINVHTTLDSVLTLFTVPSSCHVSLVSSQF